MSAQELRIAFEGLLVEVRQAGRGAFGSTLAGIADAYFPRLVSALDGHASETLSESARERGIARLLTAAAQPGLGEPADTSAWTPKDPAFRLRPSWAWGFAAVVAIVLAVFATTRYAPWKERYVAPREVPGATGPRPPLPDPKPPAKPDGPVVEKGPQVDVSSEPVPRRRPPRSGPLAIESPPIGKFARVLGEPTVTPGPGAKPVAAKRGMSLALASRIETGDADKAEIVFADGTTILVDFNTVVEIPGDLRSGDSHAPTGSKAPSADRRTSPQGPNRISVPIGRVWCTVVHRDEGEHFFAVTPVATAEVMGTEFRLAVEEERAPGVLTATLDVRRGQVAFFNEAGRVVATDLMRSSASAGAMPSEPVRIRAFPGFHMGPDAYLAGTTAPLLPSTALNGLAPYREWCGLQLASIEDQVRITRVLPDSAGWRAGFRVGDRLLLLRGSPVRSEWQAVLATNLFEGARLDATVIRGETRIELALPRPRAFFSRDGWLPSLAQQLGSALDDLHRDRSTARKRMTALLRNRGLPAYWNNLGVLWELDDRLGEALRCYRRALDLEPDHPLYLANYGRALSVIGNLPRAVAVFEAAASLAPEWQVVHDAAIRSLIQAGRLDEALRSATLMADRFPSSPAPSVLQGEILSRTRRYPEALDGFRRALSLEPESVVALTGIAMIDLQAGKFAEAEATFRRILEFDPDEAGTLNNLGQLLKLEGRLDEAEPLLRRVIEVDPAGAPAPVAYANLGTLLAEKGRTGEAEAAFRSAIRLNPEYVPGYSNWGWMLYSLKRFVEAERLYIRAMEIDPRDSLVCANLGILLFETGRGKEAVNLFRDYLRVTPGTGIILFNLAVYLTELNLDLEEALSAAKGAVDDDPRRPGRQQQLGWICFRLGRLDEAESATRKAIELFTTAAGKADGWENLGLILEKKRDLEGARAAFRKALELAPNRESVLDALKRIGG